MREGPGRIGRTECSQRRQAPFALHGGTFFDKHRRGARGLQKREVAPVGEKGELAGFGILDPGDTANLNFRLAFQAASKLLRDLGKFHGDDSLTLGASLAQRGERSTDSGLATEAQRRRGRAAVPPPPLFFVSADSKGVAGAFFVSADSTRFITPVFPALRRGVRKC